MKPAIAPNWSTEREPTLDVYLLGLLEFEASLALQEWVQHDLASSETRNGTLLICEHPPLLTVGREGSREHILCEPRDLISREIDVRWLNRGGGCILHAPGQLAIYPCLPVQRLRMGLSDYSRRLEAAVIGACQEQQVPAWQRPDAAGVWCRGGQVAQIGAAVRSGISQHGMFVNVSPRLDTQRWVRTPTGDRVTSIAAQTMRPLEMPKIRESLIRHLAQQLNYHRYHLYTGHPGLKRTRRAVAYA